MTDISMPIVAVVLLIGSVVLSVGGLLIVRRRAVARSPHHNDFIGLIFAQVALLYSVLMAFVVFSAWQRFSDAGHSVTNEAAATVVVYRDTQALPEPLRGEAQAALRSYVNEVMENEWASHGALRPHSARDALNPLWAVYRKYQPTEAMAQSEFDAAQGRLHDLELERHIRHLAGEASLPNVFWWLIIGGGIVTVAMSYLFVVERRRVHALQVGLLSGFIGGVLALIFALNFPFTGDVHVSRGPFKHALQNFVALDFQAGSVAPRIPTRTETVQVDATQSWTDTGVDLAVGDTVSITGAGTVFLDASTSAGPTGLAERGDLRPSNVITEENHGTLIARVGVNGAPFPVGSDFSSTGLGAGRLQLGVNDAGLNNNSGAFTATVTIRRG